MNILHLTDLHFNSESYEKFSQNDMINKLLSFIPSLNRKIDLVIFSGDLVFKGSDLKDFQNAKELFLDKLCEKLDLSVSDIILCPGNHDMDRTFKSDSLEEKFENKIKTSDSLWGFFKNKDYDYITALKTTENYNLFVNEYYKDSHDVKNFDLHSIHRKVINDNEIGILSINSSWRSVDDFSNGKLLFPKFLLEEALYELRDVKCIFLVLHHPIHWFKDFNQSELQNLIFKSCNIMFSGHIHESEITTHYKQNNGIFAHVSPASLTWDKDYIGFSIIDYDIKNESNAVVSKFHFTKELNDFSFIENVDVKIPCGEEKTEQNKVRSKINSKIHLELLNSKDLLLTNNFEEDNDNAFLELFNNPRISVRPKQDLSEDFNKNNDRFEFEVLLKNENNYFIYGQDKSGKSSLLKYIQLFHLKNYVKNGNIPFYVDFKNENSLSLVDDIKKYYELSREKTKDLISSHNFRLLIDNFDPNNSYASVVDHFLTEYPNVNFVVTCDYLTSRLYDDYKFDERDYKKIYLHDISRNDVRLYIEKNEVAIRKNQDEVLNKIISFCKQLELPLNYWTVSLLLMIHKKSQIDLSKNIFSLLDLCVDEILQKKFNFLSASKVSFGQLKTICAHLARFLLENNSNQYTKTYLEVLQELDEYFKNNHRIKAQAKEILDYLIASGVLKLKENERITFRLNGIFEFFIAQYMSENPSFRDELLDDKVYLSFKNEFEIYGGIKNNDSDFLNKIYEKTKIYFTKINSGYKEIGTSELILISKVSDKNDVNLNNIAKALNPLDPLTNSHKDLLNDEYDSIDNIRSEVSAKRVFDVAILDSEVYERYIAILARVFKTMDGVNDSILLSNIIDLLLETYINFGFFIHEEFELELSKIENAENKNILEIITKFLPFITQVTMSDNVSQHNIENILVSKIEEFKHDRKNNQYKLFILYLILMDIDEQNIFKYAEELVGMMEVSVLKYSTILKLNYYFAFKCGTHNQKLARFLKEVIKNAQLKLDNKIDKDKLQQKMDLKKWR
ncbi:metallophosphoesterase [Flavobacterium sp. T12S277]|uniref:metallophosphoesterase n=1 Tax=Flavobacterium sp. T12S277 TaxID=3402752 RepID=UPI003ADCB7B0